MRLDDADFDRDVRIGFVRKVLGIVGFQLAFTLTVAVYSSSNPEVEAIVRHWATLVFSIIAIFVSLTGLMCMNMTKQVPVNYILLGIFTLAESISVGNIASYYETESVIQAIVVFTITTVCLLIGSLCIRSMKFYGYSMLFSVFLSITLQTIALVVLASGRADHTALIIYSVCGSITYSIYVIVDLWLIVDRIEIDDYILGALTLYLDLITLFIHILQALGKAKN